jgi:hypothetical protein
MGMSCWAALPCAARIFRNKLHVVFRCASRDLLNADQKCAHLGQHQVAFTLLELEGDAPVHTGSGVSQEQEFVGQAACNQDHDGQQGPAEFAHGADLSNTHEASF